MDLDAAITHVRRVSSNLRGHGKESSREQARKWDQVRKYLEELKALREDRRLTSCDGPDTG